MSKTATEIAIELNDYLIRLARERAAVERAVAALTPPKRAAVRRPKAKRRPDPTTMLAR